MTIACATDRRYLDLAGPFLQSLAENGDVTGSEVIVFCDGLSELDKSMLANSAGSLHLQFRDLNAAEQKKINEIKLSSHVSQTTFVRLLLPSLLPDVDRLLYLDVDLIVNHSLRPLLSTPMNGKPIAAVVNHGHSNPKINQRIGRAPTSVYVNVGVMLMDLDQWRKRNLSDLCFDFGSKWTDLRYGDQDMINAVMGDEAELLDPTWNLWSMPAGKLPAATYAAAHIVHYVASRKPNLVESDHPARGAYLKHRAKTPWRSEPLMTAKRSLPRRVWDRIAREFGVRTRVRIRPVPGSQLAPKESSKFLAQ